MLTSIGLGRAPAVAVGAAPARDAQAHAAGPRLSLASDDRSPPRGSPSDAAPNNPFGPSRTGNIEREFLRVQRPAGVEVVRGHLERTCFPVHTHDEFTFCAIESGRARCLCGRSVCEAAPGSLVLLEPGVPHTGGSPDSTPVAYRTLHVPAGVLVQACAGRAVPTFPSKVVSDPDLAAAFIAMHTRLLTHPAPEALAPELLGLLDRIVRRHGASVPPAPSETREPRRVRVVREHLATNLRQTTSLDELSDLVGVSPFYLQRTFKAVTRMSPREYQMDLRIRRARQLLREGLTPRAVASSVGFFDQSHFTRAFRRLTGVTPGQYVARPAGADHQRRPGAA